MKSQLRLAGTIVVAMVTVSGVCAAPKAWVPNRTLQAKLAAVQRAGAFELQPPADYELQTHPAPHGAALEAWVSAPRPDGTRCYLMLLTLHGPAGGKKYKLQEVENKMLAGVRRRRSSWKQSPSESGTINGVSFIRTYWKGADAQTGQMMHGFSYVARDGSGFLQLSSQDVEPYNTETLPLMEASALTVRRLPGKSIRRTSRR